MYSNSKSSGSKWSSVWVYFALAFGITWLIEIALALSGVNMEPPPDQYCYLLPYLAPRQLPLVLPISHRTKRAYVITGSALQT